MNNVIKFNCTKCGGCCSEAPKVNFYEMLELQKDFIWQSCHNILVSTINNPINKVKAEHLQNIGNIIVVPEQDLSLFYYIDFQPINLKVNNGCPQLSSDNLCSIYGRRPARCRMAPFNVLDDEYSQIKNISIFKEKTDSKVWGCSFSEKEQPLYSEFGFKNPNHKSLFYQEINQTRDITDKYIDFLEIQDEKSKQKHFETLFEYSVNKKFNTVFSDLEFIFHMALYFNLVDEFSLNEFIDSQLKLINELNHKIDKYENKQYKILKEKYSYFLENNYFSDLYN